MPTPAVDNPAVDDPAVDTYAQLIEATRDVVERVRDDDVVFDLEDPLAPDELDGPP